mgnify:CR=1 FL=1
MIFMNKIPKRAVNNASSQGEGLWILSSENNHDDANKCLQKQN